MKILWMKSDYLHPTNRGGQIRTLGMLRCLSRHHEIHYACLDDGENPEGAARCHEYCERAYPVPHRVPERRSIRFGAQLAEGLISSLPVAVFRYKSQAMKQQVSALLASQTFDALVCDFLFPAPNVPNLRDAVLFEHNVEAVIWKRHASHAGNTLSRRYLASQARKMEQFERNVCREVKHVVAVSDVDRQMFERDYGVKNVSSVSTGVDIEYFAPPEISESNADLVFVGSMDWLPNVDGARFFIEQIYPQLQKRIPECRVTFVGRRPDPIVQELAARHANLTVTGTVDDVRPWLWGSAVSIVPLRIGGGTRLKIFEAMAARVPVVSTAVGAEGLPVEHGLHILIEDDPGRFADACIELLQNSDRRRELSQRAWELIASEFSWDAAARQFENILIEQRLTRTSANVAHVV